MKNIQVIDGAQNSAFDIFAATDEEFERIFPEGLGLRFGDPRHFLHGSSVNAIWANGCRSTFEFIVIKQHAFFPEDIGQAVLERGCRGPECGRKLPNHYFGWRSVALHAHFRGNVDPIVDVLKQLLRRTAVPH